MGVVIDRVGPVAEDCTSVAGVGCRELMLLFFDLLGKVGEKVSPGLVSCILLSPFGHAMGKNARVFKVGKGGSNHFPFGDWIVGLRVLLAGQDLVPKVLQWLGWAPFLAHCFFIGLEVIIGDSSIGGVKMGEEFEGGDIGVADHVVLFGFDVRLRYGCNELLLERGLDSGVEGEFLKIGTVGLVSLSDLGGGCHGYVDGCGARMGWSFPRDSAGDGIELGRVDDKGKVSMIASSAGGGDGHGVCIQLLMDDFELKEVRLGANGDCGKLRMREAVSGGRREGHGCCCCLLLLLLSIRYKVCCCVNIIIILARR